MLLYITFWGTFSYAQGYVCAVGGGSEDYSDWSDAPYQWVVEKAQNSKIIILGTSTATNWLPTYFQSLGASQAVNMTINNRTLADAQATYDELKTAKGIFIRGGDQWNYINYWKGTKTEQAIKELFQAGGVVAGTSAGLAVLGSVDFSARYGSVYPDNVLQNPFSTSVDLETNFLNLVPNTLFDSHFIERGRSGRLIGMLLKARVQMGLDILAVGVDDHTAFCIDTAGIGRVMGSGAVAVFYADAGTRIESAGNTYYIEGLKCDQLTDGWAFSLRERYITEYRLSAAQFNPGSDSLYSAGNLFITGNSNTTAQIGTNLTRFLNSVNKNSVALIYQNNTYPAMQAIAGHLSAQNIPYTEILLNTASLSDAGSAALLANASAVILAGDSLTTLNKLQDTAFVLSRTFLHKVRTEKTPLLSIGKSGTVVSNRFVYIPDNDIYASWRGRMAILPGLGLSGDIVTQTLTFEEDDYFENRVSALLWGMMKMRKRTGIYLSGTDMMSISHDGALLSAWGKYPWFMVSAHETTVYDSSIYRASGSVGPRQVVAMNNLRYYVSNRSDLSFSLPEREFTVITDMKEPGILNNPQTFSVSSAFPNPFNPSVTIAGYLHISAEISYDIYNAMGEKIISGERRWHEAGDFSITVNFSAYGTAAGVYYCRIKAGNYFITQKLLLLK